MTKTKESPCQSCVGGIFLRDQCGLVAKVHHLPERRIPPRWAGGVSPRKEGAGVHGAVPHQGRVRTLRNVGGFNQEGYQCIKSADGKMWEEEGSGERGNRVKILRIVFDRPSGTIELVGRKRLTPSSQRRANAPKNTKK
jgi:hypothetical protein